MRMAKNNTLWAPVDTHLRAIMFITREKKERLVTAPQSQNDSQSAAEIAAS